jgi:hypothetical protein
VTLGATGLITAYVVIGLLLLSINLYSKWSWPVKAATIVITSIFYIVTYFSIPPLLGWPTSGRLPERFRLLAIHVQEPNKTLDLEGEIFLWVTEVGARADIEPRAFRIPYAARQSRRSQHKTAQGSAAARRDRRRSGSEARYRASRSARRRAKEHEGRFLRPARSSVS